MSAYHSRAIALTLDGVAGEGCLVPLLDYCNHRNGSLHAVGVEGDAVVLRAGLAVNAGDEVLLNYGAKGNGELLRCHGFVMQENPADVVPLDLYSLAPSTARLALLARERLPLRHHLFHGGLPAQLLDAVRLLCAPTDEAAAALCDAFEKRAPQFIDWNAIDWAADDDAAAEPEVADPPVQSAADEANARARSRRSCGRPSTPSAATRELRRRARRARSRQCARPTGRACARCFARRWSASDLGWNIGHVSPRADRARADLR